MCVWVALFKPIGPQMHSPVKPGKPAKPRFNRLLAIDSWIDSTLYEASFKAGETWENITIFFRRFRVTGLRRAFFELASEGFTLGVAGSVLMLPPPRHVAGPRA